MPKEDQNIKKYINNELKQQKHKNIKKVISKPI